MPTYRLCVELFRFVSGWSDHRSLRDQSTWSIASGVSVPALQAGVILEQPTRGVPVAPPERTVPETEGGKKRGRSSIFQNELRPLFITRSIIVQHANGRVKRRVVDVQFRFREQRSATLGRRHWTGECQSISPPHLP